MLGFLHLLGQVQTRRASRSSVRISDKDAGLRAISSSNGDVQHTQHQQPAASSPRARHHHPPAITFTPRQRTAGAAQHTVQIITATTQKKKLTTTKHDQDLDEANSLSCSGDSLIFIRK